MLRKPRIDKTGKAFRGSQFQFQTYVSHYGEFLEEELAVIFSDESTKVTWVSPLAAEGYLEYCDVAALSKLGLSHLKTALNDFWPKGGPVWDGLALAHTSKGIVRLLFEAKSHLPELASTCKATPISERRIRAAIEATQRELGCDIDIDWLSGYYQYANRIAFLRWLAARVPTRLVNVYFVNDLYQPTSEALWGDGLKTMKQTLGLKQRFLEFTSFFFLQRHTYESRSYSVCTTRPASGWMAVL